MQGAFSCFGASSCLMQVRKRKDVAFFDTTASMDFNGQKSAELFFQVVIALFGLVGWIIGLIMQDFKYTVYAVALGTILALVSCLPDWPTFNRMELKWQKPKPPPTVDATSATKTKAKSK